MEVAGFGLPDEGEVVACKGIVYEWDVIDEVDECHERWGWSALCSIADAFPVYGIKSLAVVESLPIFD